MKVKKLKIFYYSWNVSLSTFIYFKYFFETQLRYHISPETVKNYLTTSFGSFEGQHFLHSPEVGYKR